MVNDSIKAKGTLQLVLTDENGNIKQQDEHNLVVNTGLAYIASRMIGTTATIMTHMGVGTGTVAAAAGNTDLGSVLAPRKALDSAATNVTTTVTNDSVQYVTTFAAGESTGAITEAGIFSALTGGTMLCRTVFPVINKGALDTLVITWKVTIA